MEANLIRHRSEIITLCRHHGVARLEVFGSAAVGSFGPLNSDCDFIARFADQPQTSIARRFLGFADALIPGPTVRLHVYTSRISCTLQGVPMTETTVFQSGNSQAVRLPKEFRFKSKTVEIFRRGDEVVLRERKRSLGEALQQATAGLPPLTPSDLADFDAAMAQAKDRRPPEERNWAMFSELTPPPKAHARAKRAK